MQKAIWRQFLIAHIIMAANNCGGCHGADGKGAGRLSSNLKVKPGDLTVLAKRNYGVFSPDAIAERIDGRSTPHRGSEMPIWGCRQGPPPSPQRRAHEAQPIDSLLDLPCDSEQVTQSRIRDIVEFLSRIQEK